MSRATEDAFDDLHALAVRTLKSEIQKYTDAGEPVPPALLAQAIKMLKDNGIDSPARAKNLADALAKDLGDFDEYTAGAPN